MSIIVDPESWLGMRSAPAADADTFGTRRAVMREAPRVSLMARIAMALRLVRREQSGTE